MRLFRRKQKRYAPGPNPVAYAYADRPDLTGRRTFFERHILLHTHIPKTAGSTLSAGLSSIVGGIHAMDLRLRRRVDLAEMSAEDLADLKLLAGHFEHGIHTRFDRIPLYFAAVRDPVERAISGYRFLSERPDHPNHETVVGKDFAEAWQAQIERDGDRAINEQARYLMGSKPGAPIDVEALWHQVDTAYFLVIPQPSMTKALQDLRVAFGLPWNRITRMNVSKDFETEASAKMRDLILRTNDLDAALYARIEADFPARLKKACDLIASHCLMPLKDGA